MKKSIFLFLILSLFISSKCFGQAEIVLDQAADIVTDTSNFDDRLTSSQISVQLALDKLDDIIRVHATDCTSLTDGQNGDVCLEQDDNTIYVCEPSIGLCDTSGEWVSYGSAGGGGDVTAASNFGTDNVLIKSDGTGKGVQSTGISIADTTNEITGAGNITIGSAAPTFIFKDDDASDGDNNATMLVNCSDIGSGSEDCDIALTQQIAGVLTTALTLDADGTIAFHLSRTVNVGNITENSSNTLSNDISGNAATATALSANGANCSSGNSPLGVDASGASEGCFDVWTESENTAAAYISNVVEDTTPQLGGNLDVNGNIITSASGGDVTLNPNGSGTLNLNAGSGGVDITTDAGNSDITINPHGSGDIVLTDLTSCDTLDTSISGELSCGTDADTTYTAGTGITLTGTTISTNDSQINHDALQNFDANEHFTQANITTTGTVTTGTWEATDIGIAHGGTGSSLSDPNEDVLIFWDDSEGSVDWLTLGSGLSITGTSISSSGGGGGGSGDVTSVGDCTDGACLDGSSDGGSYIRIYDGDSNYGELNMADASSDHVLTIPATTDTLAVENGNIATATALATNGSNCSAGSYPLGVDASGAVESCTDATTEIDSAIATHTSDADAHQDLVTLAGTGTYLSLSGQQITVDPITESDISDLSHTPDEVGTLTTGDLCVNDGSQVNCTVNTEAELETALDSINIIVSTEIDTFSELNTLVADETLVNTDDAQTLTNKTINASNNTISNIGSTQITDNSVALADVTHTDTLAGNPALAAGQCFWASTGIICEGSTANTIETLLTFTDPTSTDKTITFPNLTGTVGLSTNNLSFFSSTTSDQLAGVLSDETGSGGGFVRATSPTLTTPNLGTPSALTLTNATGLPLSSGVTGQLPLANGGTGASLSDPNDDNIFFWDDGAGSTAFLTIGSGLEISGTSLRATGAGGGGSDGNDFWHTLIVCASDTLSATDCDYTCDGTADDVQIQAAIDTLESASVSGSNQGIGLISLSDGTFVTSSTIIFEQGRILLEGVSPLTTHFQAASSSTHRFFQYENNSALDFALGLRNFSVFGDNTTGNFIDLKVGSEEIWDVRFENLFIDSFNTSSPVFDVEPAWGQIFNDVIVELNTGTGELIKVTGGTNPYGLKITNSKIVQTLGHGVVLDGVSHSIISGNELGGGYSSGGGDNTKFGLRLINSSNNIISDNTFAAIYETTDLGSGIYVDADSDQNIISSNTFEGEDNSLYGVQIVSGATNNIISQNAFSDYSTAEISDSGTETVIVNNVSKDSTSGTETNIYPHSIVVNESASFNDSGGDFDFRVEGDNGLNLLFVDASANRVLLGDGTTDYSYFNNKGDLQFSGDAVMKVRTNFYAFQSGPAPLAGLKFSTGPSRFHFTDTSGNDVGYFTLTGKVFGASGFDCIGAVDCDFGSPDITDMEFETDGTGDGEIVLPNQSIGSAEIVDDGITHANILDADQADTKCLWFENPTDSDDFKSIWANKTTNDFLLTEIWCESDQTVNLDLQIDDGTPADVNGSDLACTSSEAEDTSLSGDTTLAAGEELDLAITSVSGSPTWVSVCWTGNWVD